MGTIPDVFSPQTNGLGGITITGTFGENAIVTPSGFFNAPFCFDIKYTTTTNPFTTPITISANNPGAGCNPQTPFLITSAPLLVNINNFTLKNNTNNIQLNWQTLSEQNSNYFEIQKSNNGTTFQTIGSVNATGNSTDIKNYFFEDENPTIGYSCYRLNLVDKNGKNQYSNTKCTYTQINNNNVVIKTNPIEVGETPIIFSKTNFKVYNLLGIEATNINNLSTGIYIVKNKTGNTAKLQVK